MDAPGELPAADQRTVFTHAPMGMLIATPAGTVIAANPALAGMLGSGPEELVGSQVLDWVLPDERPATAEAYTDVVERHRVMRHESRLVRQDGSVVPTQITSAWVDETPGGEAAHLVVIVEDITERKDLETALVHRSLHDPLTGLPNRALFRERLAAALDSSGPAERVAVLFCDLDRFKQVNDTLGHAAGDELLRRVADRLRAMVRPEDTVGRLSGDEFAVVLPGLAGPRDAGELAARVASTFALPFRLEGRDVHVDCSVGVSLQTERGETAEQLLRSADDDMYRVKGTRRSARPGDLAPRGPTPHGLTTRTRLSR